MTKTNHVSVPRRSPIRNMRDVRRYEAAVHGAVRQLEGGVALVDVLALETVRPIPPRRIPRNLRRNRRAYVDWNNPAFIAPDTEWTEFLSAQQKRYPDLPNDLASTVREIHSIKIFRQTSRSEFILEHHVNVQ